MHQYHISSKVINICLEMIKALLNKHRIEYAKELLKKEQLRP